MNPIQAKMEHIGEMCNSMGRKITVSHRVIPGVTVNVTLQFYQLRLWSAMLLGTNDELVFFVKKEGKNIIRHLAMCDRSSPDDALDALLELSTEMYNNGFICVEQSEMEKE